MYVVLVNYVVPVEKIDEVLPGHVAFLDKFYGQKKLLLSGRRDPRIGGVILADVDTEEEMRAILSEDPFYEQELAEYQLVKFSPTKHASLFDGLLGS